jgi:hypothetical protein
MLSGSFDQAHSLEKDIMIPSRWNLGLAIVLTLGMGLGSLAQEKKPDAKGEEPALPKATPEEQKRIDQLIKQLGADSFDEREMAQKELEKIGLPALESLRQATRSKEAELARRAEDLVARLQELVKSGQLLGAKKVKLALKDISVADAVADLSKQSGYPIQISGDKSKLAERKITLETGEVSFWEAFDQLCLKGGLVEPAETPVGTLTVLDGTPKPVPTHYAGALRIRVVPDSVKRKDGVAEFMLEMAIEPRFRQSKVVGTARIETALDDEGKPVTAVNDPTEKPTLMRTPAALQLGPKQQTLKELSGLVMFETVLAGKVAVLEQPAKKVGQSSTNEDGMALRLDAFDKKPNGDVTIRAALSKPRPPGGIVINGTTFKDFNPELRDANGVPFQLVGEPMGMGITLTGTTLSIMRSFTFRPPPGGGEAAELSLVSDKKSVLNVPFSFKNLTLP